MKEGPQVSENPERLELNPYCGLAALCSSPWSCGILLRSQKPIQSQLAKGGGESGSLRPALEMQPGMLEGREMVLTPPGHPSFPDTPEGGRERGTGRGVVGQRKPHHRAVVLALC